MTLTPVQVRDLLDRHGLTPSRALGQNFVVDPNTVRRIARLAGVGPGDAVVEIGPGLGSLTVALADTGADVLAVEIDRHLIPALHEVVDPLGVTVVQADALTADWDALLAGHDRWVMVANLPYNVGTTIVLDLLEYVPKIERMLVMVQREVGERLAASPGGKDYGIPSVKVAYRARAEVVGVVPPTVFLPKPKVDSVLVQLTRHTEPPVSVDPDRMFELVHTAFGQRRKMLRRSLADRVAEDAFVAAGIEPTARPEELSLDEWARLANASG